MFWGPLEDPHFVKLTDATLPEKISTGILVLALVVLGIFPQVFIHFIEGSVWPIVNRLQESSTLVGFR